MSRTRTTEALELLGDLAGHVEQYLSGPSTPERRERLKRWFNKIHDSWIDLVDALEAEGRGDEIP